MSGRSRVIIFLTVAAVFAVALIVAWPSLGNGAGTAAAVGLLFGVVIGLRRVRENRDDPPGEHRGGRVDHAVPKKWQQWLYEKD